MLPSISVIIPTHNRIVSLQRTLRALVAQEYPHERMQIIVIADGCADDTAEMIRAFRAPFRLQVIEQPARGAAAARNRGAAAAEGELLLFVDDDMVPEPDWAVALVRAHQAHPGHVFVGTFPPAFEPGLEFIQIAIRNWWLDTLNAFGQPGRRVTFRNLVSGNLSLRASLFAELGGFDPAFTSCGGEDYELGIRVLARGIPITYVPDARAQHCDNSDIDKSLRRARQVGRADVLMCERHPEIRPALTLAGWPYYPLSYRVFLELLVRRAPALGEWTMRFLRASMDLFEAVRLRGPWLKVHARLLSYWYWRGVVEQTGTREQWSTLVESTQPEPVEQDELEVDLGSGPAALERQVDLVRPAAVSLHMGRLFVGRVPAQPGAEPLRGAVVREALDRDMILAHLQARALGMLQRGNGQAK